MPVPGDFLELRELRTVSLGQRLGYFGDGQLVIFGFAAAGSEVLWKHGRSSGFGAGGWRTFVWEIAPLANSAGARLGDFTSAGTHVLLLDRVRQTAYAAPRESAERFLARALGQALPPRECLCAQETTTPG